MQFQVPQFIEVEDKIFGPLTFKQFVYVVGGIGACYMLGRILPLFLAGPLIIVVGGLAAALAFFEYNGRPFIIALEHGLSYVLHPKLYLWSNKREHGTRPQALPKTKVGEQPGIYVPTLSGNKLHDLAWSLDIKEKMAGAAENETDDAEDFIRTMKSARKPL